MSLKSAVHLRSQTWAQLYGTTGRSHLQRYVPWGICLHLLQIDGWAGNGQRSEAGPHWALRNKSRD